METQRKTPKAVTLDLLVNCARGASTTDPLRGMIALLDDMKMDGSLVYSEMNALAQSNGSDNAFAKAVLEGEYPLLLCRDDPDNWARLVDDHLRYWPSGATYEAIKESGSYLTSKVYRIAWRICSWLTATAEVYGKKIDALKEAEEKGFLAGVTTKGKSASRYVDTPDGESKLQNYYDDDTHATNTTAGQSETTSDYDTPLARAREVVDRYPDLVAEAREDFERRFGIYA